MNAIFIYVEINSEKCMHVIINAPSHLLYVWIIFIGNYFFLLFCYPQRTLIGVLRGPVSVDREGALEL